MATFQYYVASTIDGFIASADDDLGWLLQFDQVEGVNEGIESFMAGVGCIAMGGDTYRWLLEHEPGAWPYPDLPSWVFTHHEYSAPAGANITFVRGDVREFAPDLLKDAGDKNVWLVGGGDLVAQFANAGLLDEMIVTIVPVVLGAGKRLLPLQGPTAPLELVSHKIIGGAAAELHYRLPTGRA
ncbi:dihydrofolate reductase [Paenarthrobacter nicotinovorans]|uniref:Dihydrofolate reductase family protein n=1 Tax=Paenarthrobacter nicotinovorans TaxID=29320 RepID=A0ABV0GXC1_PAENI|nr:MULTISPECIES: dihydrofolate reductase family protein [Micrococcaceae]MDR6436442.1 dihydrofolate reductase [Paenarthrobacter nicotinovorans]SCZ57703.1 Dihydrofolate reductase [Arthrobacter sp. UNCCL28]